MMSKITKSLVLSFGIFLATTGITAAKQTPQQCFAKHMPKGAPGQATPADIKTMSKSVPGLDLGKPDHWTAYYCAKTLYPEQKKDRSFYEALGVLPPIGGVGASGGTYFPRGGMSMNPDVMKQDAVRDFFLGIVGAHLDAIGIESNKKYNLFMGMSYFTKELHYPRTKKDFLRYRTNYLSPYAKHMIDQIEGSKNKIPSLEDLKELFKLSKTGSMSRDPEAGGVAMEKQITAFAFDEYALNVIGNIKDIYVSPYNGTLESLDDSIRKHLYLVPQIFKESKKYYGNVPDFLEQTVFDLYVNMNKQRADLVVKESTESTFPSSPLKEIYSMNAEQRLLFARKLVRTLMSYTRNKGIEVVRGEIQKEMEQGWGSGRVSNRAKKLAEIKPIYYALDNGDPLQSFLVYIISSSGGDFEEFSNQNALDSLIGKKPRTAPKPSELVQATQLFGKIMGQVTHGDKEVKDPPKNPENEIDEKTQVPKWVLGVKGPYTQQTILQFYNALSGYNIGRLNKMTLRDKKLELIRLMKNRKIPEDLQPPGGFGGAGGADATDIPAWLVGQKPRGKTFADVYAFYRQLTDAQKARLEQEAEGGGMIRPRLMLFNRWLMSKTAIPAWLVGQKPEGKTLSDVYDFYRKLTDAQKARLEQEAEGALVLFNRWFTNGGAD